MSTVAEIEEAIRKLSPKEVEELAAWLESIRKSSQQRPSVDKWLASAVGGATTPGANTDQILADTRGDK